MPRPLYVVMHIPKTAGSTLRRNFELNFSHRCLFLYSDLIGQDALASTDARSLREHQRKNGDMLNAYVAQHTTPQTDFLFGHKVNVELHQHVREPVEARYITFLREPVERVISLYHFVRNTPQIPEDNLMKEENWTLEEWIERTRRDIKNSQLLKFLPADAMLGKLDTQLNLSATSDHLEEAKRQLANFWFVGLTETFDSDAQYLYGKLGAWRFYPERFVNASSNKKVVADQTRQRIVELNSLDIEFYEFAKKHRSEFLRVNNLSYRLNVRKTLILQTLYQRRGLFPRLNRPAIKR